MLCMSHVDDSKQNDVNSNLQYIGCIDGVFLKFQCHFTRQIPLYIILASAGTSPRSTVHTMVVALCVAPMG